MHHHGTGGCVYGLSVVGAAVYFVQHAVGFWGVVWGLCKGLFWPAVLMYRLLEYLKM